MTKQNLAEIVSQNLEISKKQSVEVVNNLFEEMIKKLSKGEEVNIAGFGIFRVVKRSARTGINPKTGEKIKIPAKTVVKFRPSKSLKEAVA